MAARKRARQEGRPRSGPESPAGADRATPGPAALIRITQEEQGGRLHCWVAHPPLQATPCCLLRVHQPLLILCLPVPTIANVVSLQSDTQAASPAMMLCTFPCIPPPRAAPSAACGAGNSAQQWPARSGPTACISSCAGMDAVTSHSCLSGKEQEIEMHHTAQIATCVAANRAQSSSFLLPRRLPRVVCAKSGSGQAVVAGKLGHFRGRAMECESGKGAGRGGR